MREIDPAQLRAAKGSWDFNGHFPKNESERGSARHGRRNKAATRGAASVDNSCPADDSGNDLIVVSIPLVSWQG